MRVLLCAFITHCVFVFAHTGEGKDYDDYEAAALYKFKPEFHQNYQEAVPFGHITLAGFGDPFSEMRQPVDGVELSLREPRDKAEALKLLKTAKASQILFNDPNILKKYTKPNPKEEMLLERYVNPPPETNETMLKWYDLAAIQVRNAMRPSNQQFIVKKKNPVRRPAEPLSPLSPGERSAYFPQHSFIFEKTPELPVNWTTCDQFAVGASFDPKDVINLKWTPFYIWDTRAAEGSSYAIEHTFEYPTSKLVKEYHLKFSKMVNRTVDWTRAKLLMKGITETLLIAADKRGLFHAIVKHEIPDSASAYNLKLPSLTLRMKIEDPYLVMTFCEEYFAILMAVSGNEPTDATEMTVEAGTIKFIGTGRPIWRNIEAEKEKIKAELEAKLREESEKFIYVNK